MERHDHHAVHPHAAPAVSRPQRVPFFLSIRFRMIASIALLMLFCFTFVTLFAQLSLRSSQEMQRIVAFQANFYQGFSEINTLTIRLNHYLTTGTRDSHAALNTSKAALQTFLTEVEEAALGPYSEDIAHMGKQLLAAAQQAETLAQSGDDEAMLAAYESAQSIRSAMNTFSPYVIREAELAIAAQIDALTTETTQSVQTSAAIISVAMLALLVFVMLILNSFLRPLRALTDAICTMDMDADEGILTATDRRDEMGLLIRTFRDMVSRIRHQVEQLHQKQQIELELQREKRKASQTEAMLARSELRAYQSQINSHFLFNALNTVSRLAYMENAPQVHRAITLIAQFLRNILTQFDRVVTLQEEFSMVENYLDIQRLRFGDRIQIESVLDVEIEWFNVPALTLQPLVENAFRHGLCDSRQGFIRYAAEQEGEAIVLSVWDDGKGIPAGQQQEILQYILGNEGAPDLRERIGLRNIYRRLAFMYPGRVTPVIQSEENAYAKISFRIKR